MAILSTRLPKYMGVVSRTLRVNPLLSSCRLMEAAALVLVFWFTELTTDDWLPAQQTKEGKRVL